MGREGSIYDSDSDELTLSTAMVGNRGMNEYNSDGVVRELP